MKISRTSVLALIATVSLAAVPAAQAVAVAGPSAQQVSTAAEPAKSQRKEPATPTRFSARSMSCGPSRAWDP